MMWAARGAALRKDYFLKGETVRALRGVDFQIAQGDYVSIMGPSGSGKSTLLNLLGCLDRPTGGDLLLGEENVGQLSDDDLSRVRNQMIGFIFQSFKAVFEQVYDINIELFAEVAGV